MSITGINQQHQTRMKGLQKTQSHVDQTISGIRPRADSNISELQKIAKAYQKEGRSVPPEVTALLESQKNILKPLNKIKNILENRMSGIPSNAESTPSDHRIKHPKKKYLQKEKNIEEQKAAIAKLAAAVSPRLAAPLLASMLS